MDLQIFSLATAVLELTSANWNLPLQVTLLFFICQHYLLCKLTKRTSWAWKGSSAAIKVIVEKIRPFMIHFMYCCNFPESGRLLSEEGAMIS
jgi:hypothetical protein